jgi:sulfate adenylyltransferase
VSQNTSFAPSSNETGVVNRVLDAGEREAARDKAGSLPQITLSPMSLADLEMLAVGAMSPLTGFLTHADYKSVVSHMRLADGRVWSIPVTLPVSAELAAVIREGQDVALVQGEGGILALMTVQEKFTYDKRREALGMMVSVPLRIP